MSGACPDEAGNSPYRVRGLIKIAIDKVRVRLKDPVETNVSRRLFWNKLSLKGAGVETISVENVLGPRSLQLRGEKGSL